MKKITLQPAEKHMEPGQVKLTVTEEFPGGSDSRSVYVPEQLLYMLSGMLDSYHTNPQMMFGVDDSE